ncbi:MAG: hypothetical protein K0R00_2625 [Herbinix sp.]|jgi:hypothetical protein|nr:hypothetical protein [Herbinix sp.]
MNDNYIKLILTEYQERIQTEQAVLANTGIFPNINKPMRKLTLLSELILKTTYLLKINFLEETAVLFAFAYSKPQIEKVILELEGQGYLHSEVSPIFGKAFALTRQGIYYMKHHPYYCTSKKEYQELSINEDTIPKEAGLMKYKNTASHLSQRVFHDRLCLKINRFKTCTKPERQRYSREQYIRYFLYKDFLTQDTEEKKGYLLELGFPTDTADRYAASSLFSSTFSRTFTEHYIKAHGEEGIEALPAYQVWKARINQALKEKPLTDDFLFHFLKDFTNGAEQDKESILTESFQSFHSGISNLLRTKELPFREALITRSTNKNILTCEKALYLYCEKERLLSIQRRNLIKTNAYQNGGEEVALAEATAKLELLDKELELTDKAIQRLEEDFTLLVYESVNPDGANRPKEKVITFQQLKNSGIFLGDIRKGDEKDVITFLIVSSTNDPIDLTALFQRLEKIWRFYYKCLLQYDFEIKILCYGEQRAKQTVKTFQKALEWIAALREYQLFHLLLTERVSVSNCEFHLRERYEAYRELYEPKAPTA